MNNPNFLVNVICCTFNQSGFITQTLNGFCMQQTSFPFLCVIVDDASTDGEQEVIREYVTEQFDLSEEAGACVKETDEAFVTFARHKTNKNCYFAVYFLKENHYSKKKSKEPYYNEYGKDCKYIATCEGDDYWIAEDKLQKQVGFLEKHPDYGAVYTDFVGYRQDSGEWVDMHIVPKSGQHFETMMCGELNIWTLTICYRAELRKYIPSLSPAKYFAGDILLFLTLTSRTKVYCLAEKTAVYRYLKESASHFTDRSKAIEFQYRCVNDHLYFLSPEVSPKTVAWVHDRCLRSTLRYALAFNRYDLLDEIACSFSELNSLRSVAVFMVWKFAKLSKSTFNISRHLAFKF